MNRMVSFKSILIVVLILFSGVSVNSQPSGPKNGGVAWWAHIILEMFNAGSDAEQVIILLDESIQDAHYVCLDKCHQTFSMCMIDALVRYSWCFNDCMDLFATDLSVGVTYYWEGCEILCDFYLDQDWYMCESNYLYCVQYC